jgi:hypothetical protein
MIAPRLIGITVPNVTGSVMVEIVALVHEKELVSVVHPGTAAPVVPTAAATPVTTSPKKICYGVPMHSCTSTALCNVPETGLVKLPSALRVKDKAA